MGHSLGLELFGLGNMNRLLIHGDYILHVHTRTCGMCKDVGCIYRVL